MEDHRDQRQDGDPRYHQKYVYAASTLFKATPVQLQAACGGARLRTGPKATAPTKTRLANGTRVTATWIVPGDAGASTAAAASRATGWYRITAIDGVCVRSLYGTSAALRGARPAQARHRHGASAPRDERLHRGHRRQPLPEHDRLGARRGCGQAVRVHEGLRLDGLRRPDLRHQPRPGEGARGSRRGVPLRPPGRRRRATRSPRPTTSSRRRSGAAATCCRCWTSRRPAASASPTCRRGCRRSSAGSTTGPGVKAMIYTSPSFWTNKMGDTQAFAAAGYKSLWVAHWTTNPSATVPAVELGRQRLDLLAVHVGRKRARASGPASTSTATTARTSVPSDPVAGACASPRLLATWKPAGPQRPPTTTMGPPPRSQRARRPRPGVGHRRRRGGGRAVRRPARHLRRLHRLGSEPRRSSRTSSATPSCRCTRTRTRSRRARGSRPRASARRRGGSCSTASAAMPSATRWSSAAPGSTAAINRLVDVLNLRLPADLDDRWDLRSRIPPEQRPVVFVGPFEHHSNELPWRESIADLVTIREDRDGYIDLDQLAEELGRYAGPAAEDRLVLGGLERDRDRQQHVRDLAAAPRARRALVLRLRRRGAVRGHRDGPARRPARLQGRGVHQPPQVHRRSRDAGRARRPPRAVPQPRAEHARRRDRGST